MATDMVLQALRVKQREQGLSLRQLASEIGITQPHLSMLFAQKRRLTADIERKIQLFLSLKSSVTLTTTLQSFILRGVHRSPKTIETLRERLIPFIEYLTSLRRHKPAEYHIGAC